MGSRAWLEKAALSGCRVRLREARTSRVAQAPAWGDASRSCTTRKVA